MRQAIGATVGLSALCILIAACGEGERTGHDPSSGRASEPVTHGPSGIPQDDRRRDLWEEQNEELHGDPTIVGWSWLRGVAQQSAIMLTLDDRIQAFRDRDDHFFLGPDFDSDGTVRTLAERKNLCPLQLFAEQEAPGFCSATLIDDDLILTAAHCVRNGNNQLLDDDFPINRIRAVFNFYNVAPGTRHVVRAQDIFHVREVLTGQQVEVGGIPDNLNTEDFAILRLTDANGVPRSATPEFHPSPVRTERFNLPNSTPIAMVGAPTGTPIKIAADTDGISHTFQGTTVKAFFSGADGFAGDSGGGTYELSGFRLAGVNSRGPFFTDNAFSPARQDDYVRVTDDVNSCRVVGVCPTPRIPLPPGITAFCAPNGHTEMPVVLRHLCEGTDDDAPPGTPTLLAPAFAADPRVRPPRLCDPFLAPTLPDPPSPPNDACQNAEEIRVQPGKELTLSGSTLDATLDDVNSACPDAVAPSVFYRFTIPADPNNPFGGNVLFYADTFNSNFDTVLYVVDSCSATEAIACQNDSSCIDLASSQLLTLLTPGDYVLGVSGAAEFGGGVATGDYIVHIQTTPASLALGALEPGGFQTSEDTSVFENSIDDGQCRRSGAPDIAYFYTTCPEYVDGQFGAATCFEGGTFSLERDTVLAFHQGNRPFVFCNDDAAPPFDLGCRFNGVIGNNNFVGLPGGEQVSSGSGLRTLVVDGFDARTPSRGFFDLLAIVPAQ